MASETVWSGVLPDEQALFELFATTGWNAEYKLTSEELYKAVGNSFLISSATIDGRLVGFGRVVSDGILHGLIYEMIVHPAFQGRGIGSALLQNLISLCREKGIRELQLFCASGREKFYTKNGFVTRPEDAPGMTLILK